MKRIGFYITVVIVLGLIANNVVTSLSLRKERKRKDQIEKMFIELTGDSTFNLDGLIPMQKFDPSQYKLVEVESENDSVKEIELSYIDTQAVLQAPGFKLNGGDDKMTVKLKIKK